ncbi:leucine-rich repeat receptor-like protein FASCIATED EAR2 [Amborella trichopoda]|uniref:leucine-rich repeat receptor-like protein FASCIATED EAR2 n=1 Tax=Amborella trichopoda TaxID=13333 RepID=UPI0005D3E611|nr:leucine-rich repeat receptor-like protein FASCIATED EAR2 [Amborella trichopoda]|eukprot:XP_011620926.1 leucine-rich repeat receptor-like protein FASCIATED EAR2 [Amborella trichopoda]
MGGGRHKCGFMEHVDASNVFIWFPVGICLDKLLFDEETSHLQWETWKRLFVLDLSGNVLSGNIPPSLGNCSSMQFLNLNDNDLFGSLPCSLVALENLNSVELSNNWFSGEFPQALKNWSSLSTLDLSGNEFAGNIPS